MALTRRNRGFLQELNRRLNQWLPTDQDDDQERSVELSPSNWRPETDVYEEDDDLVFEVEAPGLHKDDLDVELDNGLLTISGQRREERDVEEDDRDYYRTERFYGSFQRSFALPESVDAEDIRAEYNDGVLTVRAPQLEESTGRNIQID